MSKDNFQYPLMPTNDSVATHTTKFIRTIFVKKMPQKAPGEYVQKTTVVSDIILAALQKDDNQKFIYKNTALVVLDDSTGYNLQWCYVYLKNEKEYGYVPRNSLISIEGKIFAPVNATFDTEDDENAQEPNWQLKTVDEIFEDEKNNNKCVVCDSGLEVIPGELGIDAILPDMLIYGTKLLLQEQTGVRYEDSQIKQFIEKFYMFSRTEDVFVDTRNCSTFKVLVVMPLKYLNSNFLDQTLREIAGQSTEQGNTGGVGAGNGAGAESNTDSDTKQPYILIFDNMDLFRKFFNSFGDGYGTNAYEFFNEDDASLSISLFDYFNVVFRSRQWNIISEDGQQISIDYSLYAKQIQELRLQIELFILKNMFTGVNFTEGADRVKQSIFDRITSIIGIEEEEILNKLIKEVEVDGVKLININQEAFSALYGAQFNRTDYRARISNFFSTVPEIKIRGKIHIYIDPEKLNISKILFFQESNNKVQLLTGAQTFYSNPLTSNQTIVNYIKRAYNNKSIGPDANLGYAKPMDKFGFFTVDRTSSNYYVNDEESGYTEWITNWVSRSNTITAFLSGLVSVTGDDYFALEIKLADWIKEMHYPKLSIVEPLPLNVVECIKDNLDNLKKSIKIGKNLTDLTKQNLDISLLGTRKRDKKTGKDIVIDPLGGIGDTFLMAFDFRRAENEPELLKAAPDGIQRFYKFCRSNQSASVREIYKSISEDLYPGIIKMNIPAIIYTFMQCSASQTSNENFQEFLKRYKAFKKYIENLAYSTICNPLLSDTLEKFSQIQIPRIDLYDSKKSLTEQLQKYFAKTIIDLIKTSIIAGIKELVANCMKNDMYPAGLSGEGLDAIDDLINSLNNQPQDADISDLLDVVSGQSDTNNNPNLSDEEKKNLISQAKQEISKILEKLSCLLTLQELCNLLSAKTASQIDDELVTIVINLAKRSSSSNVKKYFKGRDEVFKLFNILKTNVEYKICERLLDTTGDRPIICGCDLPRLNKIRKNILEDKGLDGDQIKQLLGNLEKDNEDALERAMKLLNPEKTLPPVTPPICSLENSTPPPVDLVNRDGFRSLLDSTLNPVYELFDEESEVWPRTTYSISSSTKPIFTFDSGSNKISIATASVETSNNITGSFDELLKKDPSISDKYVIRDIAGDQKKLPSYIYKNIISNESYNIGNNSYEPLYSCFIDGNEQQILDANIISNTLRKSIQEAEVSLDYFIGQFHSLFWTSATILIIQGAVDLVGGIASWVSENRKEDEIKTTGGLITKKEEELNEAQQDLEQKNKELEEKQKQITKLQEEVKEDRKLGLMSVEYETSNAELSEALEEKKTIEEQITAAQSRIERTSGELIEAKQKKQSAEQELQKTQSQVYGTSIDKDSSIDFLDIVNLLQYIFGSSEGTTQQSSTIRQLADAMFLFDSFVRRMPSEANDSFRTLFGEKGDAKANFFTDIKASIYINIMEYIAANQSVLKACIQSMLKSISGNIPVASANGTVRSLPYFNTIVNGAGENIYIAAMEQAVDHYKIVKDFYKTVMNCAIDYPNYNIEYYENNIDNDRNLLTDPNLIGNVYTLEIKKDNQNFIKFQNVETYDQNTSNYIRSLTDQSIPNKFDIYKNNFESMLGVPYKDAIKEVFQKIINNCTGSSFMNVYSSNYVNICGAELYDLRPEKPGRKQLHDSGNTTNCNITNHYLDIDLLKKDANRKKDNSYCLEPVPTDKEIISSDLPNVETSDTQNIILDVVHTLSIRLYLHDICLRAIATFGYYNPQIIRDDNLVLDFFTNMVESEIKGVDVTYYRMMVSHLFKTYYRNSKQNGVPAEDLLNVNNFKHRKILLKSIIREELKNNVLPKIFKRIAVDTNGKIHNRRNEIQIPFIHLEDLFSKSEILKIIEGTKLYSALSELEELSKEYIILTEYLFPIKRLITLAFITNSMCTATRRSMMNSFIATKSLLRDIAKSTTSGGRTIIPDQSNPQDVVASAATNVDTESGEYWAFVRKALVDTPLSIAKGYIETTDPNVAFASGIYKIIKIFDPSAQSTIIPVTGAAAFFFIKPIFKILQIGFPIPLPVEALIYYGLGLWYEKTQDEDNDSARQDAFEEALSASLSLYNMVTCDTLLENTNEFKNENIATVQENYYVTTEQFNKKINQ